MLILFNKRIYEHRRSWGIFLLSPLLIPAHRCTLASGLDSYGGPLMELVNKKLGY